MWSGPRNISTAMMRAWENRDDTQVWDEPFYAAYLHHTGLQHPMREAIIEAGEINWKKVAAQCSQERQGIFYQKHMTHHILPGYNLNWLANIKHCFLLRDPKLVLNSYRQKHDEMNLGAIGLSQQLQLFQKVKQITQSVPLVIDSEYFLANPEKYLRLMCNYFEIAFSDTMLQWSAGARSSDGVWASHWYDKVWASTNFEKSHSKPSAVALNHINECLISEAEEVYQELRAYAKI